MTEFYLDIETTGFDFQQDNIVWIQVGEQLRPDALVLFKIHEFQGEKEMLKAFIDRYPEFLHDGFGFVAIGYNLTTFDLPFIYSKLQFYGLLPDGHSYMTIAKKPCLDLKHLAVCLNRGNFRGASLDKFSSKKTNGEEAKDAIAAKDWERLDRYVHDEYLGFLDFRKRAFNLTIADISTVPKTDVVAPKKELVVPKNAKVLPPANKEHLLLWYSNEAVQYEIVKQMRFRYLSCKKADHFTPRGEPIFVRYFMCYTVDLLEKALKYLGSMQENTKLYYDLARWHRTEFISWNSKPEVGDDGELTDSKRKQQIAQLMPKLEEYLVGLNFGIDLDAPNQKLWKKAHKDALKIREYLEKADNLFIERYGKRPTWRVGFSGKKGFHFEIPLEYFMQRLGKQHQEEVRKWLSLTQEQRDKILKPKLRKNGEEPAMRAPSMVWVDHHLSLAIELENLLGLTTMDHAIYDVDRVLATPYTISEVGLVVLPLSDEQLDTFSIEMCNPVNVTKNINLINRGLLWRNP